jgi:hypothetical protein
MSRVTAFPAGAGMGQVLPLESSFGREEAPSEKERHDSLVASVQTRREVGSAWDIHVQSPMGQE